MNKQRISDKDLQRIDITTGEKIANIILFFSFFVLLVYFFVKLFIWNIKNKEKSFSKVKKTVAYFLILAILSRMLYLFDGFSFFFSKKQDYFFMSTQLSTITWIISIFSVIQLCISFCYLWMKIMSFILENSKSMMKCVKKAEKFFILVFFGNITALGINLYLGIKGYYRHLWAGFTILSISITLQVLITGVIFQKQLGRYFSGFYITSVQNNIIIIIVCFFIRSLYASLRTIGFNAFLKSRRANYDRNDNDYAYFVLFMIVLTEICPIYMFINNLLYFLENRIMVSPTIKNSSNASPRLTGKSEKFLFDRSIGKKKGKTFKEFNFKITPLSLSEEGEEEKHL